MLLKCTFRARGVLGNIQGPLRTCYSRYSSASARVNQSDQRLRILFCGSEQFSASSLRALSEYARSPESNIESIDVVTRKDKNVGRGLHRIKPPFIKKVAEKLELPLHQIDTFTGWSPPSYGEGSNTSSAINLIIAVSFGLLVPPRILRGASYGGLNVHPSLLPQFKGAAPIHWTILRGLRKTGVSLQTLHESKFDEGTVLDQVTTSIQDPDTCTYAQLRDQLAPIGADLLVKGLREKRYISHSPIAAKAETERIVYAPKFGKKESAIDPQVHGALQLVRMQRAFTSVWDHAQDSDGNVFRVNMEDLATGSMSHSKDTHQFITAIAASVPVGLPFGILRRDTRLHQAGQAPLFLNTIDGTVMINALTVSGGAKGPALAAAARGRLLKFDDTSSSRSGEAWDIYKFHAPLRGDSASLPALVSEIDGVSTE